MKVSPQLTAQADWIDGEVIDVEHNPFMGLVISIKDKLGRIFFGQSRFFVALQVRCSQYTQKGRFLLCTFEMAEGQQLTALTCRYNGRRQRARPRRPLSRKCDTPNGVSW